MLCSFSCLVTIAKTSSKMLNGGSRRVHPCFIFDLRGKALSPLPLAMMLSAIFFVNVLYQGEDIPFSC